MATPKIYTLAAAAVGITGAVFMPSSSYGLGGAALNAAIPVTPREAVTASPAISISGASVAASAAASSAGASGASSSSAQQMGGGGNAAATAAGTGAGTSITSTSHQGHRPSGGAAPATGGAAASAKAPVWDKNVPPVPVVEENPLTITFTAGWDSKYIFKYRDVVSNGSNDFGDAGVWYGKVALQWEGLGFYAGYVQADSKTTKRLSRSSDTDYYGETLLGVNYTVAVVPDALDLTAGYNAVFYNSDQHYNTSWHGELFARLAYTQIPFVTPSLTYSYFHCENGGFIDGQFLEGRLDGNVPLYNSEAFSVGLNPYASIGYDMDLNGAGDGWAAVQLGLRVPFAIGDNWVVTLSGHYGIDIATNVGRFGRRSSFDDTEDVGFWGGASVTYKF